jgi:hypothetical protein
VIAALCVGLLGCGESIIEIETPENPCAAFTPISVGQQKGGELSASDCSEFDGVLTDRWSLTLGERMPIRIDMTSPTFEGYLELMNESGVAVGWGADGQTNARIGSEFPAGRYTVVVRSYPPGATGEYTLAVAEAPECASQGNLVLGESVSGTAREEDCWFEWTTVDNWSLTVPRRQKYRIDLKSSDFDEILLLRDENGFVQMGADWSGPSGHARLDMEISAGDWTLSVATATYGDEGSYTLSADLAPACTPGSTVVFGETLDGELSGADCLFESWAPADSFALVLLDGEPFDLVLKSTDMDPFMLVRDQRGVDVAWGTTEYGAGISTLRTSLDPGRYALFVFANSFPGIGSYQLTAGEVECPDIQSVAMGGSVEGRLDVDDCVRSGGAYQDRFELVLANDTTVRIDLTADFDAYLILRDSAGVEIERDDDGGPGFDARIERSLAAGTYEIDATSFNATSTGTYKLSVDAPPPPAAEATTRSGALDGAHSPKVSPTLEDVRLVLARLRMQYEARYPSVARWLESVERRRPRF